MNSENLQKIAAEYCMSVLKVISGLVSMEPTGIIPGMLSIQLLPNEMRSIYKHSYEHLMTFARWNDKKVYIVGNENGIQLLPHNQKRSAPLRAWVLQNIPQSVQS